MVLGHVHKLRAALARDDLVLEPCNRGRGRGVRQPSAPSRQPRVSPARLPPQPLRRALRFTINPLLSISRVVSATALLRAGHALITGGHGWRVADSRDQVGGVTSGHEIVEFVHRRLRKPHDRRVCYPCAPPADGRRGEDRFCAEAALLGPPVIQTLTRPDVEEWRSRRVRMAAAEHAAG